MPNYKICRFCPEKYVPIANEKLCPKCKEAVINAMKSETFGEPILVGTMPDPVIEAMKQAVADANPEIVEKVVEAIAPVIETIAEIVAPIANEIVRNDIAVIEEVVEELDKGEDAEIIKEEIIAPAAPKPEEKPNAPS